MPYKQSYLDLTRRSRYSIKPEIKYTVLCFEIAAIFAKFEVVYEINKEPRHGINYGNVGNITCRLIHHHVA